MKSFKILTVCLGNICRSPAAQGILEKTAANYNVFLELDSAGTAAYHVGNSPDPRSIAALQQVGIDISRQKARQVRESDFYEFDWIVAMDKANLMNLREIQPPKCKANVVMFGEFSDDVKLGEVDDPYYGGDEGFSVMQEHLSDISTSFLQHLKIQQ